MKILPKILWIICGFLIVAGIGLVTRYQLGFGETKKISGIKSFNGINLPTGAAKLPVKKNGTQEPNIFSHAAYLIDVPTFFTMYAKEENTKVPVASTTKITTALVVLENHTDKLQEVVTITLKMVSVEGSDIQLRAGEKIIVENLVNGLLIMSGNDTAYALSDYFGGEEKFVAEMNEKVSQIGVFNTKYQDPAGLDDNGYSTAHDLAIIASYALRNQKFAEIVKTPEKTIASTDGKIIHELKNSNRLLRSEEPYYFPYTIGVKTGFTDAAGHVLVSGAEKDGHKLLAVVLNTQEDSLTASAQESKKLLEWGFENWTW